MTDRKLFDTTIFRMSEALVNAERMSELLRETITTFETQREERSHRAALIVEAAATLFGGDNVKAVTRCLSPVGFLSGSLPLKMTGSDEELGTVLDNIGRLKHGIPL